MKNLAFMITFVIFLIGGCAHSWPTDEQLSQADYGPQPENPVALVNKAITDRGGKPLSSHNFSAPEKGFMRNSDNTGWIYGYVVRYMRTVTSTETVGGSTSSSRVHLSGNGYGGTVSTVRHTSSSSTRSTVDVKSTSFLIRNGQVVGAW